MCKDNYYFYKIRNFNESDFFQRNGSKLFKVLWVEDDPKEEIIKSLINKFNSSVDIYLVNNFDMALYVIDTFYHVFEGFIFDIRLLKNVFDYTNNPHLTEDKALKKYVEKLIGTNSSDFITAYSNNPIISGGVWLWAYLLSKTHQKPVIFYSGNQSILGDAVTQAFTTFGIIGFWEKGHELSQEQIKCFMNKCRQNLQGVPWLEISSALFDSNTDQSKLFSVKGKTHSFQEFFPEHNFPQPSLVIDEYLRSIPVYNQARILKKFFESSPVHRLTHENISNKAELPSLKSQIYSQLENLNGQLNPVTFDKIKKVIDSNSDCFCKEICDLKTYFRNGNQEKISVGDTFIFPAKIFTYSDGEVLRKIIDLALTQCKINVDEQTSSVINKDDKNIQMHGHLDVNDEDNEDLLAKILTGKFGIGSFFHLHKEAQGYARVCVGQYHSGQCRWICLNSYRALSTIESPEIYLNLEDQPHAFLIDIDFSQMGDMM